MRAACREVSTIHSVPACSTSIRMGCTRSTRSTSTSDPETIGNGITSGCTGLLSQDMLDLYARTPVKTKVIVLPA